jgi:hypothetical protein
MTQPFTPDITFILGPPTDPALLARHRKAQGPAERGLPVEQFCLRFEPRLTSLIAENDGDPSILSRLVSIALDAPVRVVDVGLGYTFDQGRYLANFQLRANLIEGPADAIARLFGESGPARILASYLRFVLKLEWVSSLRRLPVEAEEVQ